MFDFNAFTVEQDHGLVGLPIHYGFICPPNADSAVVLMPSARTSLLTDRSKPYFPRWSWAPRWPDSLVITVADPVLSRFPKLDGGWFVHRDHDVVAGIAGLVDRIISKQGIPPERVTFYGSSLGGYGAIAAATQLPGSRAVAEVPQIEVANWMPRFVSDLEAMVLQLSMSDFRQIHPERLSLAERILAAGFVPPIHLITNVDDYSIADQRQFITWASSVDLPRAGRQLIEEVDHLSGHRVLSQDELVSRFTP